MKKILIIVAVIISILCLNKEEEIIIPESSIRFRVIASSNSIDDQIVKNNLTLELSKYITSIVNNSGNIDEARNKLSENYNDIKGYIDNYINKNNIKYSYNLSLGDNYFPEKNYNGVTYPEGHYESLVVSLGKSEGLNWWCVVYPPLCTIDPTTNDVEYTTIAKELLNKINS